MRRESKSENRKVKSEHRVKQGCKTAPTNGTPAPRRPKMTPGVPPNGAKRGRRGPKRGQKRSKTTPIGALENQKSDPKRQDEKRTEPSRPKTVLDRHKGRLAQLSRLPRAPFGRPNRHQNGTENDSKSKRNIKRRTTRSKTILDPSWVDLGSFWVLSWGPGNAPDTTPADVS